MEALAAVDDRRGARLQYHDLGPLLVERDGEVVALTGGRLTAALSVLLIHADRRVGSEALVEAIWGADAASRSASTLDSHVFRLRKVLEPDRERGAPSRVLLHDAAGGYRLLVDPDQVDSLQFQQLADETVDLLGTEQPGRALRRAKEALSMWRGRPFAAVADEPWAEAAVARLEEIHAQVQQRQVDALLGVGESERALVELGTALHEHPLRERLWAQRMLACYRAGRIDDALRTYQDARLLFLDELGVEPGGELRDLQGRILADDPSLAGPRPTPEPSRRVEVHLPGRLPTLIGRQPELARLTALLAERTLVSLVGAAGCGKTRLAVEVARRSADSYPDGVWFADLTPAQDADQLLDVVMSGLGVTAPITGLATGALRSFTEHRRMLIVLDNCEHLLVAAGDLVDALLDGDTELAVLATSREPLGLPEETVLGLDPLPVPSADDPDAATAPAVELFLDRLAAADPSAQLDERRLRLAVDVCTMLDGVPLALELAAARARAFSLEEIVNQVASDPSALSRIGRGAPAHRTVGVAVEQSYAILPPDEAALHRSVSVVPGPFTVPLAAALGGRPLNAVRNDVAGLVHRSMLVRDGPLRPGGPSRFRQLAIVRSHAEHAAAEEVDELHRRRDHWVVDLVGAKPRLGHPDEAEWFTALDDNLPAIRATLQHALVDAPATAAPAGLAVVARLGLYWYYRGARIEGRRWLDRALATDIPDAGRQDLTLARLALGGYLSMEDRYDLGLPYIEAAIASVRDDADIVIAEALAVLTLPLWAADERAKIAEVAARIGAAAARTGDQGLQLLTEVSALISRMGAVDPAESAAGAADLYNRAVALDNRYAVWVTSSSAAAMAMLTGDVQGGLAWSDRALAQHLSLGVTEGAYPLEVRADLLTMAGRNREAVRLYAAARAHCRRAGMRWPIVERSADLSQAALAALDRAEADAAWVEGGRLLLADLAGPGQVGVTRDAPRTRAAAPPRSPH